MKVLVPIDVESLSEIAAAIDTILDNPWPSDVQFHLLNVIEDEMPGGPCDQPTCRTTCQCLEPRVRAMTDVLRALENKMPGVPIFIEIVKGNLNDMVANRAKELGAAQVLTPRPVRPRYAHPLAMTALVLTVLSACIAIALVAISPTPAGGFMPTVPPGGPAVIAVPRQASPKVVCEDELRLEVLCTLGDAASDCADYTTAVSCYKQSLSYLRKMKGVESRISWVTGGLSLAYCGLGDMTNALKYGQASVTAAMAARPRNFDDISIAYNNLAYLQKKMRKFAQSETMYEWAIVFAPMVKVEDRVRAATIEANLAEVYALNKKEAKALAAYKHALQVLKRELPANHDVIREVEQKMQYFQKHRKVRQPSLPIVFSVIR